MTTPGPDTPAGAAPRNVLLVSIGTGGDIYPFIGLGDALRRRGHRVALLSHAAYRQPAEEAGLDFHAVDRPGEIEALLARPELWDRHKGVSVHAREFLLPNIPRVYNVLRELCQAPGTVMAANISGIGARIVQEKFGVPLATLILSPNWVHSRHDTPLHFPEMRRFGWTGSLGKALFYFAHDLGTDLVLGRGLNRFRASVGLRPVRRQVYSWLHSPRRVIGCWPEWFAAPQPDWPDRMALTGFLLYDRDESVGAADPGGSERIAALRPIVFTAGTGMMHAREFFATAVAACRRLGLPGCLVARHAEQIPTPLPPGVVHLTYVPFSTLFPGARAVVHHGGIGTTAQALAAGVPQYVVPHAFDQFDNANRLVTLGVARSDFRTRVRADDLAARLRALIDSGDVARACASWRPRVDPGDAFRRTCELVEQLGEPTRHPAAAGRAPTLN